MTATANPRSSEPPITCSIGLASALFNLPDWLFIKRFIRTRCLKMFGNELRMKDVLKLYDRSRGIRR